MDWASFSLVFVLFVLFWGETRCLILTLFRPAASLWNGNNELIGIPYRDVVEYVHWRESTSFDFEVCLWEVNWCWNWYGAFRWSQRACFFLFVLCCGCDNYGHPRVESTRKFKTPHSALVSVKGGSMGVNTTLTQMWKWEWEHQHGVFRYRKDYYDGFDFTFWEALLYTCIYKFCNSCLHRVLSFMFTLRGPCSLYAECSSRVCTLGGTLTAALIYFRWAICSRNPDK